MTDRIAAPQPYDTVAATYDRLGELVIASWGEKPHSDKAEFLAKLWSDGVTPVKDVLELACGTGLMLEQLAERGYRAVGLDRSAAMLGHARDRLGPDMPLVQAELPDIPLDQDFDAIVSPGSSLNYLTEAELAATFRSVKAKLRPGGVFAFDILAPETMGGPGGHDTLAGDFDDLAFILTYAGRPGEARCDMTWTQFRRTASDPAAPYVKTVEHHRLYRLTARMVRAAAHDCGLTEQGVYDNYTLRPLDDTTAVQTWVFRRPGR